MKTGQAGRAIIKKWEGLPKPLANGLYPPYICPTGYWTLGYGSLVDWNGEPVTKDSEPISLAEAEQLLTELLPRYEGYVSQNVKVPLNQNQFDALVSWTYNLGVGNLRSSTMLKKLNAGDYDAVPSELVRWNKGRINGISTVLPGLKARRSDEAALWATPVAPSLKESILEASRGLPEALSDEQRAVIQQAIDLLTALLRKE